MNRIVRFSLLFLILTATFSFFVFSQESYKQGFVISSFSKNVWKNEDILSYDNQFTSQDLELTLDSSQKKELRITIKQIGNEVDAAHIDYLAMQVGNLKITPDKVIDLDNGNDILFKVSKLDNDVVDVKLNTLEAIWKNVNSDKASILINAREEELDRLPGIPFSFPPNLDLRNPYTFANYKLKDDGAVIIDGKIDEKDKLNLPSFSFYGVPVSGHPPGYFYIHIKNDGDFIYIAEDITLDNTFDKEDWSKVYFYTTNGAKEFEINKLKQKYGMQGFGYTDKVSYEHNSYEFKIPISEIGKNIDFVKIGFQFYGTADGGGGSSASGTGDASGDAADSDAAADAASTAAAATNAAVAHGGNGGGGDASSSGSGGSGTCGNGYCGDNYCTEYYDSGEGGYICSSWASESCSKCHSDCGSCGSSSSNPPPPPQPSCAGNAGSSCSCGSCGCGGTIQCNGACSGSDPTPGNYNQPCGSCGRGRINCAGQCSGDYSNCGSAGYYNTGSSCGNCGTQQQYCNGCDWTGSYQCINQGPCSPGQAQCVSDRYQTCSSSCQWQNSGTNSDSDAKDLQCGDSLCDQSQNVYDSTRTATENPCTDSLDNDCDLKADCNDTDCDGSIAGNVKTKDNTPISEADISAKKDLATAKSSITNSQGNYNIAPLACGTYNIVASHPDYAPKTQAISLAPNQQMALNFEGMVIGTSCEPDCTFVSDNLVHASCDAKNGCAFHDGISKAACDNSQPGWLRDYNETHYVACASGTPQPKVEIQASVSCASGTLVKVTRIVVYNGKPVKLVVAACD